MASLPFSTFNATLGAPDDSTTPPDASDRDWSSIIGITTAITGNILIALALNVQRFAHIQLHEKRAQIKARVQLAQRRAKLQAARGAHGESHELALNYEDVPRIHVAPSSDSERINVSAVSTYGTVSPSRPTPGSPPPATSPRVSNDDDDSERDFLNDDDSLSGLSEKSLSLSYLRSPYWWLGQVLITLGEMGNFLAYGFAPASIVSPLGVVALVSNCVIAPILFQEKFRARDFWGVVIAVAGVVVVVLSSGGDESKLGPHDVWDAITALAFEVYLCVTVAMIATLMWASKRYGKRTILIDLGLVGLFGGYTALATKGVSSMLSSTLLGAFQTPVTYALLFVLIATAVMQIRYLNRALQRFDSTQVIPIQFVMFTLCVIVGSAILYRDFERTTAAQSLKFISGCLFTFFGVFLITGGRPKTPDEENQLSGDDEFDDTIGLASQESYPGQEPYSDVTPPGTPVSTVSSRRSSRGGIPNFHGERRVSLTYDTGIPSTRVPHWPVGSSPHPMPTSIIEEHDGSDLPSPIRPDVTPLQHSLMPDLGVQSTLSDILPSTPPRESPISHPHSQSMVEGPTTPTPSRPPSRRFAGPLISASPFSSAVSAVMTDTLRRSSLSRKTSMGRLRQSIRQTMFMDEYEDDAEESASLLSRAPLLGPVIEGAESSNAGVQRPSTSHGHSNNATGTRNRHRSLSDTLGGLWAPRRSSEVVRAPRPQ